MGAETLFLWSAYALSAGGIAVAVSRRRGFLGTIAWVLAMLLLPGIGAVGYFLLADPRVRRTRRLKRRARVKSRDAVGSSRPDDGGDRRRELAPMHRSLLDLAARLADLPATAGNRVELLVDNAAAFRRIEAAIVGARRSIWAEYYIVSDDETGRWFLDALTAKARQGVDVRLLYDAVGSSRLDRRRLETFRAAGGKAAAFLPVNPLRRRWSIQLRNHRKILVVDAEVAFTGGMNVGDEYSGSGPVGRRRPWRDAHVEVRGPAVGDLSLVFAEDWCFATDECAVPPAPSDPRHEPGAVVAVLPSGPDREHNAHEILACAAIASATSRCYLSSPYFVPSEPTLHVLEVAALRGVDTRLLVPERNDIPLMQAAIRSFYPRLLRAGVRIYEYRPTMLHAKTIVADGEWGLVGSANLDMRSFRLNFEVGVLVFDPEFAGTLERRFLEDLAASVEVTPHAVEGRGFLTRLWEGSVQLLAPLL